MGINNIDILKPDSDEGDARDCPYCGHRVYSTQAEIDHMNEKHPEIIEKRLRDL